MVLGLCRTCSPTPQTLNWPNSASGAFGLKGFWGWPRDTSLNSEVPVVAFVVSSNMYLGSYKEPKATMETIGSHVIKAGNTRKQP